MTNIKKINEVLDLTSDDTMFNSVYIYDRRTGKPKYITIDFLQENPAVWKILMTSLFENFEVSITGTRIVSGNGAFDNKLYPCYAEILDEVNDVREKLGLSKIFY